MKTLKRALRAKKRADKTFNGTIGAASKLMIDVGHQTLRNLVNGDTRPWRVTVHTKNEILRLLGPHGMSESDFTTPP